jgi:hypothetical protein
VTFRTQFKWEWPNRENCVKFYLNGGAQETMACAHPSFVLLGFSLFLNKGNIKLGQLVSETRTEHLQNTGLEHCRCSNMLDNNGTVNHKNIPLKFQRTYVRVDIRERQIGEGMKHNRASDLVRRKGIPREATNEQTNR